MKPKFRSLIAAFAPLSRTSIIVCASVCAATSVYADQTWKGTTDLSWATLTNWSGGAIPLATDTVIFDATSVANTSAITLGANRTARGITVTSPAADVTIATGSTLTLASGGINMSSATKNFTSVAGITVQSAMQPWNVASGFTLNTPVPVRNGGANNDNIGGHIVASSTGTIKMGAAALAIIADNGPNPYVTIGTEDWAATDATGTVTPVTYTTDAFTGNASIVTPATYATNGVAPTSVRFANTTGPVIVTNSNTSTLRGILMTSGADNVTINGGSIRPNRSSTAGCSFSIIQNNTAKDLTINSSLAVGSSGAPASYIKGGPGRVIFTGGYFGGAGRIFINEGIAQYGDGGIVGDPGTTASSIINNASLVFNRSNLLTVITNISGTGSLSQIGSGELAFTTSTSTFTGPVNVNAGILSATSLANLGSGTAININGGAFKFSGVFDPSGRTVSIGASGATFDTNGQNVTFAAAVGNGGTGSLTKAGLGSLTLTQPAGWTGGTVVNAGTLLVNNVSGSGTSGAVSVASGATLGGTGTASGVVTVASSGNLAPGAGVGTLNVGSLALQSGSTGVFEFNSTPANDKVAVATPGGLTINGGAITVLQAGTANAFTTPGTYNLISYSGSISGIGVSSLSVANPQAGYIYTFAATGSFVTLKIETSGTVAEWGHATGGSWATAGNWVGGVVPNSSGATANLLALLTSPGAITLDGNKTVGAITFNNTPNSYTVTQGTSGSLTINNGALAGAINNNGGAHEIAAPIILVSNTALSSASAAESTTFSGVVSGAGTLTKPGPGKLFLLGNNTFGGDLTLSGGTTTFANGGLGLGNLSVSGISLIWSSGNTQDISNRTITFGANPVTFDTNGNNVAMVTSAIGGGGAAAFTKAGLGRLTFDDNTTFTGNVTISGGVLQLGAGGATGAVLGAIIDNAQLEVKLADASTFSNLVSGTGSFVHSGTGSLTLNASNTFSGTTTITSSTGSLILTNALNLQNSTLNYPSVGGTLNVGTLTAVTLGGLDGNKNLGLDNTTPAALALTIGGNGLATTYSGILSGSGSLTKTGAGITTLTGANTFAGDTTISGGVLAIDAGGSISGGAINTTTNGGGQLHIISGTLTATTGNLGQSNAGLFMDTGSGIVTFSGALTANSSSSNGNSAPIRVYGGTLNVPSISLGRTGASTITEPTAAAVDSNLYISGGAVNVSGDLIVGTYTGTAAPASTVVTRINGGSLTVGGAISVGLNNSGRWSYVDVHGGTLVSTGTAVDSGVVLGGPLEGKAAFLVNSGIATVERIQFGRAAVNGQGLINVIGGELYVGSGGIVLGSTGTYTSETRIPIGGVLGAKADWSSLLLPTTVSGGTIKAADSAGTAHNITITGPVGGTFFNKTGLGTLTLSGANFNTGASVLEEGILNINGQFALGGAVYGGLTFSGGTLQYATAFSGNGDGDISKDSNGVAKDVYIDPDGGTIDTNGNSVSYANPIGAGGGGGLTKIGVGSLTLNGGSTYSGNTTVTAGTLQLNADNSSATGAVLVSSGATLAGTGKLGGDATISSGGHQAFAVAATTGAQATRVIAGNLNLNSGNVIDLSAVSTPAAGGPYVLATATSIVGTPTVVNLTGLSGTVTVVGGNTLVFTASAGTPYSTWASSKGLTGSNNGATQDPDFDGISNALEFVLGGNPLASDTSKLPVLTTDATNFIFTFNRADESESEIGLTFQWGSALTGWNDVPVGAVSSSSGVATVTVTENTTLPDTIVVTVPKTSAVGSKLFGRLKAVK